MADKRLGFMAAAAELLFLAFAVGFFSALLSVGASGVIFKYALAWELVKAGLAVASWAPAIILVASALSSEAAPPGAGFAEAARAVMMPAFGLAAVVSVFFLLVVPGLEERRNRYEGQSQLFASSLAAAEIALGEGRIADADRALVACAAIDPREERYVALYERIRSAELRALAKAEQASVSAPGSDTDSREPVESWDRGNRFYLEALAAREAGRAFDAHYLAKRSAAIYDKRPEVRRLVEETWRELQSLPESAEDSVRAARYERKLEGYERFQEGDFLEAYRIFLALASDAPEDDDVTTYLARSARGLEELAFFIEDDERAFSRSDERGLSIRLGGSEGWTAGLRAARAASAEDAVYFRDLELRLEGPSSLSVSAPFARLHDRTLTLRAVDRDRPDMVWEPTYGSRPTERPGIPADPGYAVAVPFSQADAARAIRLSGAPEDIPIADLALGMDEAARLGLDAGPLLAELAGRAGYPFAVLMLALLGAGLGLRFKPSEPVGTAARLLSGPALVALAIPPLKAARAAADVMARVLATLVPPGAFLVAWIAVLGGAALASLLVSARIAGRGGR